MIAIIKRSMIASIMVATMGAIMATIMAKTIMIATIMATTRGAITATTIVTTRSTKAMNIQKNTAMLAHTEGMAHTMASTMATVLILQKKVTPAIAMVVIMEATMDT